MALAGVKVIEFAGLAPVPMAGMILADWGANVVRIDRPQAANVPTADVLTRGKRSISVDVRSPEGLEIVRDLISTADVLLDPYRPGVLEKLGLGPEVFLGENGRNPRLVYGRLSGFEVTGPHRDFAGHDLNYFAATGALHLMPKLVDGTPGFPLNVIADFAGGSMVCTMGILLALIERSRSGKGQTVQSDMVSGTRYVSSFLLAQEEDPNPDAFSISNNGRILTLLSGEAPFYRSYRCKDGGFFSVACIEPHFFRAFIQKFKFHVSPNDEYPGLDTQADISGWPKLRNYLVQGFMTHTRDEWTRIFSDTRDACVFPVLTPAEASSRRGEQVPTPHPALSRTPAIDPPPRFSTLDAGLHTSEVLAEIGYSRERIAQLQGKGIIKTVIDRAKL